MPKAKILDLKKLYGQTYKVTYEESYPAENSEYRSAESTALRIINGKHGHVFPWSGTLLAASTNKNGRVAAKLRKLPNVRIQQDGDDGITLLFKPEMFEQVADLLQLRKRPQISEEERQRRRERMTAFAHEKRSKTALDCVEAGKTAQNTTESQMP